MSDQRRASGGARSAAHLDGPLSLSDLSVLKEMAARGCYLETAACQLNRHPDNLAAHALRHHIVLRARGDFFAGRRQCLKCRELFDLKSDERLQFVCGPCKESAEWRSPGLG